MAFRQTEKEERTLIGVYRASMGISLTALSIVALMEVFMLGYSVVNAPLYGTLLWRYRAFYALLLLMALAYIGLSLYAKSDMAHRYKVLSVASPLYTSFFFAWALGITFFDATYWSAVDPMVFMTFSLIVPLGFFVQPFMYVAIAAVADICMISLVVMAAGTFAQLTNISIFCVFQIVLGFSFLRLRYKLAKRILEERDNARIDELTGFLNRRAYDQYAGKLADGLPPSDLVYVTVDLNGLKVANDLHGHETGDKLIAGAAECMRQCFGDKGNLYRMGGDEFVALIHANKHELDDLVASYEKSVETWSNSHNAELSTALGYACCSEYPLADITQLAQVADQKMYANKAHYYEMTGKNKRIRTLAKGMTG